MIFACSISRSCEDLLPPYSMTNLFTDAPRIRRRTSNRPGTSHEAQPSWALPHWHRAPNHQVVQLSIVPTLQRGNAALDAPASGFVQRYEMLAMNPRLSKTLPRSLQVTLERQHDIPTLERGNDQHYRGHGPLLPASAAWAHKDRIDRGIHRFRSGPCPR